MPGALEQPQEEGSPLQHGVPGEVFIEGGVLEQSLAGHVLLHDAEYEDGRRGEEHVEEGQREAVEERLQGEGVEEEIKQLTVHEGHVLKHSKHNDIIKIIKTARIETGIWCRERWDFLPIVHGGRVSEKSLGVSTLQAVELPDIKI